MADAPVLSRLQRENREHLLSGAPLRDEAWMSEEGQRAVIEHARRELEADRSVPLLIEADGEVVGALTLSGVTRGALQSANLGYWVSEQATGRGIATAAVGQIIDVAFGPMRLHRLQAEVQVGNDASARVLARHGFTEYGLAPQYLELGGQWRDCRMFQLLNPRWGREESPEVEVAVETPGIDEALALYDAVGWSAYTRDPDSLAAALAGSAHVVTARRGGRLVGLARVISDGATIAYLQDVLVHPDLHRSGVGSALVRAARAPFSHVRQTVLMTDAEPGQRAFYESLGLTEIHDAQPPGRVFVDRR